MNTAAPQPAGGSSPPIAHDGFRVSSTVAVLFSRLPVRLRDHIAFRHFFTPELDPVAHGVCIKFFTLLIFYFTTVFRLEGRRRHYQEHNTASAGAEFYAAHVRAQRVFKDTTTCYSIILSRYNVHSDLQYKVSHAFLIRGRRERGPYAVGLKDSNSLQTSVPAFTYAADEMLFYEHLFQMLAEVVRLAFSEDAKVQDAITKQLGNIFRSPTFTFNDVRRSEKVTALTGTLESKGLSLMENTQQLAELLTAHNPKMIAKYAIQQRSPFVANFLPGGNSFMKYQRPRNNALTKPVPTKNEKMYTVETKDPPFPMDHRAMVMMRDFNERMERKRLTLASRKAAASADSCGGGTTTLPNNTSSSRQKANSTSVVGGKLSGRLSSSRPESQLSGSQPLHLPPMRATGLTPEPMLASQSGSMMELLNGRSGAGSRTQQGRANPPSESESPIGAAASQARSPPSGGWKAPTTTTINNAAAAGASDSMENTQLWGMSFGGGQKSFRGPQKSPTSPQTANQAREAKEAAFHAVLSTPLAEWATHVSVAAEVEALFQAVVNGVPIGDLAVPKDIMLEYDDTGILQINREGDPVTA